MEKLFIFDLDGVVVDTARLHCAAWKELASSLGIAFTERDNERLKGVSRRSSLEIILSLGGLTLPDEEKERLCEEKNRRYVALLDSLGGKDIMPGAVDFIAEARRRGTGTALASSSRNASLIVDKLSLASLFDCIVDGNAGLPAKPEPALFLACDSKLGVKPSECTVFEDSDSGIEAAHRAHMRAVGMGKTEALLDADALISSFTSPLAWALME